MAAVEEDYVGELAEAVQMFLMSLGSMSSSFSFLPFFLPVIFLLLLNVYVKPTNTSVGFCTHSDSTHQI